MKLKQLSVFLENKPGQLSTPVQALADAGINIVTLSLADTKQFGILRLLVRDWEKAQQVLEEAECVVNVTDVVAVDVPDRPGGLAKVLSIVQDAGINVEYMYAFTSRVGDRAVLVFRFEDPDGAISVLEDAGMDVVDKVELYDTLEE
jgi:hypothetical protein